MKRIILAVLMVALVVTPCLAQEIEPEGIFSIEGTEWTSLPIGVMIFPIPLLPGLIGTYKVGFYDGQVYEYGNEETSFFKDMLVLSVFMYAGESCRPPGRCIDYRCFGIMQRIGVGLMIASFGAPIPISVGAVLLVKTNDNWKPAGVE